MVLCLLSPLSGAVMSYSLKGYSYYQLTNTSADHACLCNNEVVDCIASTGKELCTTNSQTLVDFLVCSTAVSNLVSERKNQTVIKPFRPACVYTTRNVSLQDQTLKYHFILLLVNNRPESCLMAGHQRWLNRLQCPSLIRQPCIP